MATSDGALQACSPLAGAVCADSQAQAWVAVAVGLAVFIILFDLVAGAGLPASMAKFREWRISRLALARAAMTRPQRDYTAALIDNAARDTFRRLFSADASAGRRASRAKALGSAEAFEEADWFRLISTGAVPDEDGSPLSKSLRVADNAFDAGNAPKIADASQRVIAHLVQRDFQKAAVMYACETALRADAISAPTGATAELARRALALSDEYGCVPAQVISALLLARCAMRQEDFTIAREVAARATAVREQCAPPVQIAITDVQAELHNRVNNFERARALLKERLDLERRAARGARDFRLAHAHYLADMARVDLSEAQRGSSRIARLRGRRATKFLTESLPVFQTERDVCALSLTYTRLAMAEVMQRHLNRATLFARQGRKFAELMRSADLVTAADDLVRRIDAERVKRGIWSWDWIRSGI